MIDSLQGLYSQLHTANMIINQTLTCLLTQYKRILNYGHDNVQKKKKKKKMMTMMRLAAWNLPQTPDNIDN